MNEWVQTLLQQTPYFGVFGVLLMCGLGLPLPEDMPLLFAGYLVHQGSAAFGLMVVVGMIGVLAGDCIIFGFGRRYGEAVLERPLLRRLVSRTRLAWAEQKFVEYGKVIIFAARFMPGARPVFFATAGIFRVRPLTFVLIDGFAAMISVPVWILVGWKFGKEAHAHLGGARAKYVFFGALAVVLVCWIAWEIYQKRKHRRQAAAAGQPAASEAPRDDAGPQQPGAAARRASTGTQTDEHTEVSIEPSSRR